MRESTQPPQGAGIQFNGGNMDWNINEVPCNRGRDSIEEWRTPSRERDHKIGYFVSEKGLSMDDIDAPQS